MRQHLYNLQLDTNQTKAKEVNYGRKWTIQGVDYTDTYTFF